MEMNIQFIDIGEYRYPMSFSLACVSQMGNFAQAAKKIEEGQNVAEAANMMISMLYLMIDSGCAFMNIMRQKYDRAPMNDDGLLEPIPKDKIGYLISSDPEELKAIVAKIKKCISKSKERKIQAKPLNSSKKKEEKKLQGDSSKYLMVKAYKIGIPSNEFLVMPLGYLADLTDASVILDGYADEYIEPEYINVDLR